VEPSWTVEFPTAKKKIIATGDDARPYPPDRAADPHREVDTASAPTRGASRRATTAPARDPHRAMQAPIPLDE